MCGRAQLRLFVACSLAQRIPEDIYFRVLRKTYTSWELVDTADVAPALYNEGVISLDDFQYYTNSSIHGGERRNELLYQTLVNSGSQPNILVKIYQTLLKSPLQHQGIAEEIRRCGKYPEVMTECIVAAIRRDVCISTVMYANKALITQH